MHHYQYFIAAEGFQHDVDKFLEQIPRLEGEHLVITRLCRHCLHNYNGRTILFSGR